MAKKEDYKIVGNSLEIVSVYNEMFSNRINELILTNNITKLIFLTKINICEIKKKYYC